MKRNEFKKWLRERVTEPEKITRYSASLTLTRMDGTQIHIEPPDVGSGKLWPHELVFDIQSLRIGGGSTRLEIKPGDTITIRFPS